ncbi:MFS transporter [Solihabitans fulvus]|uniref:MFS transporter n=1 Tax=Solihabitans fulvus TaxID=1892852 RepID=A0A5B2WFT8_9PSEU|nr:MFS transporter [Solihabitans fulvus]KAA2250731.1 MFS transporter [Solihabitans fulvus]
MATAPSRWVALATLTAAVLLVAVDNSVLGLAVPFLSRDLAPTADELLWIGDSYSFVLAGLLVTMGTLGDRIGRKRLLLSGAVAFGVLSVLVAYSRDAGMLIASRALLGVAGATLMPSTLSIIRNLFADPRERTAAIGLWGAASAAGVAAGPILGGVLLEHFWWGSVFLINVPVMVVLVAVGSVTLPESRDPRPGPLDPASVGLSLVGVVGAVFAAKRAAVGGGWPTVAAAGLVGVAGLAAFVRRQLRLSVPLIDVRLFRGSRFGGALLADLLAVLGLSGVVFFVSQYFQLVRGFRPLLAGVAELPLTVGAVVGGLVAGPLARRWGAGPAVGAALGLAALAMTGMLGAGMAGGYPLVAGALLLAGCGTSVAFTLTADIMLSSVVKEKAGAASSVEETGFELGAALGIALLGSVITVGYRAGLVLPAGAPEAARDSLGAAVEEAGRLPPGPGEMVLRAARQSFVEGMHAGAVASAVCLAVAAVATLVLLRGDRGQHSES